MSTVPIETLRSRASEQRTQLHQTASDLREKIRQTREDLSLQRQVRRHLLPVSIAAAVVALGLGYAVMGLFVDD